MIRSTKVILQVSPGSFVDVCTDHLPKNKKNFLDRNFLIGKNDFLLGWKNKGLYSEIGNKQFDADFNDCQFK